MKIVGIQFAPWDKVYHFDPKDIDFKAGDYAIVKTNIGVEIGRVAEVKEVESGDKAEEKKEGKEPIIKPVLRKANKGDLERLEQKRERKEEVMIDCQRLIRKHNLPMKLVDVRFSLDGGRIVFAFISKERVDFRKLVEDLTRHFQKSIRMQQIGVRGEARVCGDLGICGRKLCCRGFLKNLGNVTLELVHDQQVAHRGIDRLSGACGRLLCCLAYEEEYYKELIKNMPPMGSIMKAKKGKGEIVGWHILKQTVNVRTEDKVIVEVPVKK